MPIQLSDTRKVIERSLFEALRSVCVEAGYLANIKQLAENNITSVNTGTKKITINSINLTELYQPGRKFNIIGSTSSDSTYTVISSIYQGGNTIISILETIASSISYGKASIYNYYDDNNGVLKYREALGDIAALNGFAIEVFGVSQHRSKYQKKVPRVVIVKNQSLPGALGGDSKPIYIPVGNDPLNPTSYTAKVTPPQTVDFTYDIHIVCSTAEQSRVCHAIVALALPKRGYVKLITDPTTNFFVEVFSYRNIPDPSYNITEDIYMYKVSDMYETDDTIVEEGIKPMTEITADIKIGTQDKPTEAIEFGDDLVID